MTLGWLLTILGLAAFAAFVLFMVFRTGDGPPQLNESPVVEQQVVDLTTKKFAIAFRTERDDSRLVYLESGAIGEVILTGKKVHLMKFAGLQPDTAYRYRLSSQGEWHEVRTGKVPPSPPAARTVWGTGVAPGSVVIASPRREKEDGFPWATAVEGDGSWGISLGNSLKESGVYFGRAEQMFVELWKGNGEILEVVVDISGDPPYQLGDKED